MEWKKRFLAALLAALLLACGVTAYAAVGTEDNPLVTLSYLRETFTNNILAKVEEKITETQATYEKTLEEKIASISDKDSSGDAAGNAGAFAVAELRSGQTMTMQTGGEFMLRDGSAACTQWGNGFLDTTSGLVYDGGELISNHLYMVTDTSLSIKASSAVTLLVRGNYTVS